MLSKLYKLMFDISICYTLGGFLLNYYGKRSVSITAFLILLLTALLVALLNDKKKWEILVMTVLPLGALLLVRPSIPEMILFLLVWVYLSYVILKKRFVTNRGVFVDMLKRFALLLLIVGFLALTGSQKFASYIEVIGPFLSASLISAIFLLRNLRANYQMEQIKQYRRQQIIELVVFLVVCIILTVLKAPQNMAAGLALMYQHLLLPFFTFVVGIIGLVIMGLVKALYALISLFTKEKEIQIPEAITGSAADKAMKLIDNVTSNVEWVRPILYSLAIMAGLVAIFFFFRWLMGEKFKQSLPEGVQEIRESIEDNKNKKKRLGKKPKDARGIVRYYYSKFLLWMKLKQVQLQPQDTTTEIADKYKDVLFDDEKDRAKAALQLKDLYQRSRYQTREEITAVEADKAKKLYNTIKKSKVPK